ncbi:K+-transporting ATPase ATPase C chain [Frankineae bacterium MT45]|nr:K+-transporting ATPase ATPase C chain [Frankineae bacterium MT45]
MTSTLRSILAALRMLLILTVILGIAYPLGVLAVAQLPGLRHRADGSLVSQSGHVIGSSLIGQNFLDKKGDPLPAYLQPRPSAAGTGYDPTATGASNLGPESIVDTLPDPSIKGDTGKQSLLTQVCARSLAVGSFDGVSGARPFCTADGVGAVLAIFWSGPGYQGHVTRVISLNQAAPTTPFLKEYQGVAVQDATFGGDYSHAQVVAIRGDAPATPAVPADAVTASGSGLDPEISPAYATIQLARIAAARRVPVNAIAQVVRAHTTGRDLGFIGTAKVNVLAVNLELDQRYPVAG